MLLTNKCANTYRVIEEAFEQVILQLRPDSYHQLNIEILQYTFAFFQTPCIYDVFELLQEQLIVLNPFEWKLHPTADPKVNLIDQLLLLPQLSCIDN